MPTKIYIPSIPSQGWYQQDEVFLFFLGPRGGNAGNVSISIDAAKTLRDELIKALETLP